MEKREKATYAAKEGFVIRFDYISGVPSTYDKVFIKYGYYKKTQKLDP
jgi:hypothetical protein